MKWPWEDRRLIVGEEVCCFGVTEPDAGLDTGRIATFARRDGGGYVVDGRKMWTSTAQVADRILLLARTTPREKCRRSTDGLTLFYTALDRDRVEVREIPKMGRASVDSNALSAPGNALLAVSGPLYSFSKPWFVNFRVRLFSVTVRTT